MWSFLLGLLHVAYSTNSKFFHLLYVRFFFLLPVCVCLPSWSPHFFFFLLPPPCHAFSFLFPCLPISYGLLPSSLKVIVLDDVICASVLPSLSQAAWASALCCLMLLTGSKSDVLYSVSWGLALSCTDRAFPKYMRVTSVEVMVLTCKNILRGYSRFSIIQLLKKAVPALCLCFSGKQ